MYRYQIVFFIILTLLAVYSLYRTYADVQLKAKAVDHLALSVEQLKLENKEIKQEIAEKKTRDFIEFEAVSKLGLSKRNQEVIIVPGKIGDKKIAEVLEIKDLEIRPVEMWLELFFKNNPFRH